MMMLPLKGLLFIFLWPKGVSANVIHTENVRGQVLYETINSQYRVG